MYVPGAGSQRANALGDLIHRQGELVVVRLEHQVQCLEHRPGDVPVEVVCLQIQRVRIRKDSRQAARNLFTLRSLDTNVDLHAPLQLFNPAA